MLQRPGGFISHKVLVELRICSSAEREHRYFQCRNDEICILIFSNKRSHMFNTEPTSAEA